MTKSELAKAVGVRASELDPALKELEAHLVHGGLRLLATGDTIALVTAPEASEMIDALRKEELSRDLGKAGAETLATVLYRGPSTRSEIEYVRGVNCASILRSLLIRGLIDRVPSTDRKGRFVYIPTAELLAHLGVSKSEDLPEYAAAHKTLTDWESEKVEETSEEGTES